MRVTRVRSVLVVDDFKPFLNRYTREVRSDPTIELHIATSATEALALALARRTKLDYAILDVRLERGPSGLDLARMFRPRHPQLKIGVISAEMDDDTARAGILVGADQTFQKPIACRDVIAQLDLVKRDTRSLAQIIWDAVHAALFHCGGNRRAAARLLGKSRPFIKDWAKKPRPVRAGGVVSRKAGT